jgi:DNA-binding MarR family transcriptional regulator
MRQIPREKSNGPPPTVRRGRPRRGGEAELTLEDYRALAEFRYQIRRFLSFSEQAAHAEGLEPQQHQLLLAVRALDPPDIGKLADYLMIRHHSAVGLIDRLEERGLVKRRRNKRDRRQVHVILTPEGEERLKRLSVRHRSQLLRSGLGLVETLYVLLERWSAGAASGDPSSGDSKEENVSAVPK